MFIDGSPHAVTDLWDVAAHHYNMKFSCNRCGHMRVFHAAGLWWLFKQRYWNDHLSVVPKRLACCLCRSVLKQTVRPRMEIVSDQETGEPLPLPPTREWKRYARRRR